MHRRQILIGAFALVLAKPGDVAAAGIKPFDAKAFAAAQAAGQGIVVHVHAPW